MQRVNCRCVLSLISLVKPMKTFARKDSEDIRARAERPGQARDLQT